MAKKQIRANIIALRNTGEKVKLLNNIGKGYQNKATKIYRSLSQKTLSAFLSGIFAGKRQLD